MQTILEEFAIFRHGTDDVFYVPGLVFGKVQLIAVFRPLVQLCPEVCLYAVIYVFRSGFWTGGIAIVAVSSTFANLFSEVLEQ